MIRKLLATISIIVLGWAGPLIAQVSGEGMKGGNIEQLPMERPVAEYALLVLFLLAALWMGFYTSRRTND